MTRGALGYFGHIGSKAGDRGQDYRVGEPEGLDNPIRLRFKKKKKKKVKKKVKKGEKIEKRSKNEKVGKFAEMARTFEIFEKFPFFVTFLAMVRFKIDKKYLFRCCNNRKRSDCMA